MFMLRVVIWLIRGMLSRRWDLVAENLALRQQLLVLQRGIKRSKLHRSDRRFWIGLYHFWEDWRSALLIV